MDRRQVLAYRIAAQGLHREHGGADTAASLAVFDLGVQDGARDVALLALTARLDRIPSLVDDPALVLVWSHRGAQHYHRRADLPAVTRALVPLNEADAMARLGWRAKQAAEAGMTATDALFTAARAMREVVPGPTGKGAASTAISKLVPEALTYACRGCQATHILENLFRLCSLPGGVRLVPGESPATLAPLEGRGRIGTKPDPAAVTATIAAYLTLHGPATAGAAAGFVGTSAASAKAVLPDLVPVDVEGKRALIAPENLAALESPPEPDLVRLLPPWDPFLQARDRDVLVPDRALQKEVWRMLGNPGALLADGEISGVWRSKTSGRRLDFTVSPFWTISVAARKAAGEEAARIAAARGFTDVRVAW
ncbi:DNA glycosylase AlkZ-like family protein [Amycolatopsis minnesotensis]|uniref:Crosslink repair DNA glycosylase YcaQ family protein n=1 Tax=Amycolatopsis minnesotensis TaxID=337894 RepID=A0ABN2RIX4_9PSEU